MNLVIESTGPLVQQRDRRDDRALLKVLARACRSGVVAIEGDCVRLQHIHSPVMSQADGNQWVLAIGAVFGLIWWFLSLRWALGVLPIGIVLYWTIGRKTIWRRLMRRVDNRLDDPVAWNKLWEFGGLALREDATGRRCAAPDEDWRRFVQNMQRNVEVRV
jgi:hypothetical protein